MILKFWGTRGSIPVPGKNTLKYGGNTPCVEVLTKPGRLIILDAGSGLRELGKYLTKYTSQNTIDIFISHYHWDHIQGIPFFLPLFNDENKITFHGQAQGKLDTQELISRQMSPSFFPVEMKDLNANIKYKNILPSKTYNIDDVKIQTLEANHSAPTIIYKLTRRNKSIVYVTDNELLTSEDYTKDPMGDIAINNKQLINFCKDCDYLIHDTMYDETTVKQKKGWGHSSNVALTYFSILAGVKNLVLFHYNPDYTDKKIDKLLSETKSIIKAKKSKMKCIAAREGKRIAI